METKHFVRNNNSMWKEITYKELLKIEKHVGDDVEESLLSLTLDSVIRLTSPEDKNEYLELITMVIE